MTATPFVTVVIPVHNRASLVQRTLDCVAAQTLRPLAVVLVDNNSSDGTRAVLDAWADTHRADDFVVTVVHGAVPGAAAARNAGLAVVDTPWTMFFDSDDVMAPEHLAGFVDAAVRFPSVDIIGWDVDIFTLGGKVLHKPFAVSHLYRNCIIHGTMATQRYAARTELFRRAGGWDPSVPVWNDIELGCRLLSLGPRVEKRTGPVTVNVFETAVSVTGTSWHGNGAGREHALECMLRNVPPSAVKLILLKQSVLAGAYTREGYSSDGERLISQTLRCCGKSPQSPSHAQCKSSRWLRIVLRLAYRLSSKGIPGTATFCSYII